MNWISVKEKPPTREEEPYLFHSNKYGVKFGAACFYRDELFVAWAEVDRDGGMDSYDDVDYWMPLPPPPNQ